MTFEEFKTWVLAGVEEMARGFKDPRDDFKPWAQLGTSDEQYGLVDLRPFFLKKDDRREELANQKLPKMIQDRGVTRMALVVPSWMVTLDENGVPLDPELDTNRREGIFVTLIEKGGRMEHYNAILYRRKSKAPVLGAWESQEHEHEGFNLDLILKAVG